MRLCVIGGGLTGAIAVNSVRRALPQAHIELWDREKQFGGRMCTKQCPSEPRTCSVDIGAQYISNTPTYKDLYKEDYDRLLSNGVLTPISCKVKDDKHPPNTDHYIAPLGMNSVVTHYVKQANCTGKVNALVTSISKQSDEKCWKVRTESGEEGSFDAVLITLPVPQLLALHGDFQQEIDSSGDLRRFCLALFYPASEKDRIKLPGNVGASYLSDPKYPFCYMAVDTVKRGLDPAECDGVSVIVHTSRQFGSKNVDINSKQVHSDLLKQFREFIPQWPEPKDSFCHKWRYSQVTTPLPAPYTGSVSLSGGSIILSGDAFTHSNFDGCLSAGKSAALKAVCFLKNV